MTSLPRQSSFESDTEEAEMSDERPAEIEAVAQALAVDSGWCYSPGFYRGLAEVAIDALDRVRDARGDDEAALPAREVLAALNAAYHPQNPTHDENRSPQGEDHEDEHAAVEAAPDDYVAPNPPGTGLRSTTMVDSESPQVPQGEDHEALQRAVRAFVESWWEFDSLPPQDHYNAVAERVQVLDDILDRVSAPKADENQEAS